MVPMPYWDIRSMWNTTQHVKFAHYMINLESLAAILDWSKQNSGKHNNEFLLKLTLFPTSCNKTASQYDPFLSAVANFRNELLASWPFVCPHGTTRLTPDVFFREILCWWHLLKSVAKIQISFEQAELRASRIIHEDANTLVTSYLIQGMKNFRQKLYRKTKHTFRVHYIVSEQPTV
jgi:hypothetical protein